MSSILHMRHKQKNAYTDLMEMQINLAPSAIPSATSGPGVWDAAMTLVAQSAKKSGFSIIGRDTCAYTSSANLPCLGCAYILDSKIALSFSIALRPSIYSLPS